MKDQLAIIGMGCSKFGERWDCGLPELILEAATEAFADAGIGPKDIDICYYSNTNSPNSSSGTPVADTLKIAGIPILRNENWCTSGHIAMFEACMAVMSGMFDIALVIGAEKLKDTGFGGLGTGRGLSTVLESRRTAPGSFALAATRYFSEYGLSPEEGKQTLAKIAVKNHANGALSPRAHFHNEITLEQVMKAATIAAPLGLFDCCGNSDGAAAAIITRADMARNFRDDPIYIKGMGIAMDSILPHYRPNFGWTSFDALKQSSSKAYELAGIKDPRKEIDLAEVHDCFTITEMLVYEDFGFSPRGKAKEDIDAGFFERTGGLPVNVDGGLKCFGHPVGASGIRMTYEIYKQLQYKVDNPNRQIADVHRGLSHTFGGPPQISAVLIAGNEKG